MSPTRRILLFSLLTLAGVVALSAAWEYGLEHLLFGHRPGEGLPAEYRIEFLIQVAVFSLLSLIFPIWYWLRAQRGYDQQSAELQRLATILDSTSDLVSTATPDGRVQYLNRAGCELLGIEDRSVLRACRIADFHPQAAAHTILEQGLPEAARHGTWQGETELLVKGGQAIPVSQVIVAHRDASGEVAWYSTIMRDISSLKRTEMQMRLLSNALEQSGDLVIVTDRTGRIEYVNPAFTACTGYRPEEVIGQPASVLKSGQMPESIYHDLWATLGRGEVYSAEFINRCKDGALYFEDKVIAPVRDAAGDTAHYVSIGRDVSVRKQIERRLRESEGDLARAQAIAHIGNWDWHIATGSLAWSDEIYRIFGLDPGAFSASYEDFLACVHPDDRDLVTLAVEAALQGGEYSLDHRICLPSGEVRVVHEQAEMEWDGTGRATRMFGTVQDVTEQRRHEEQLRYQANYDALTGLANRTLLGERLEQEIARAQRHDQTLALLFVDLDNFKLVNDSLGHSLGDRLLSSLAQRLRLASRGEDTVARYGGDEFVVVSGDMENREAAFTVAEKLHGAVSQPFDLDGEEVFLTTSIGIALYPSDGVTVEELIRHADIALYRAKDQGGNLTQFYAEEMGHLLQEHRELSTQLKHALERQEFVLHYQPQLDLHTGRVTGMEALLRWQHPKLGLVAPMKFIPMAEESGLIVEIGAWVLREACCQAKAWLDQGTPVRMAVNLSARQFRQRDLAGTVVQALSDCSLPAQWLELELTESALMQNVTVAVSILRELKKLGVGLSVDDFGTGYSSLSYLKNFPIDWLKIDRSFVRDVVHDADDAAIARAVVALAHNMGIKAIAEGVEDEAQLAFLRQSRCDSIQGYLLSPPVPAIDAAAFLGQRHLIPNLATPNQRVLLLIDDEDNVRSALRRVFRGSGYRLLSAASAREAQTLLAMEPVGVVLCDYRMPDTTGTELMAIVKRLYPDITRILLSGYADLKAMRDAINTGAVYKFLSKPWEDEQLLAVVREGFERYELEHENQKLYGELKEAYDRLRHMDQDHINRTHHVGRLALHEQRVLQCAQSLIEEMPMAVVGVDEEGMVVLDNDEARRLFGAGLVGMTDVEALPALVAQARAQPDGLERWHSGVLADGQGLRWMWRHRDVGCHGNGWLLLAEKPA